METRHRPARDNEIKPVAWMIVFAIYPATWLASITTLITVLLVVNDTPIRAIEYASKYLFYLSLLLMCGGVVYNVDHKVRYMIWPISLVGTVVFFFMIVRMID